MIDLYAGALFCAPPKRDRRLAAMADGLAAGVDQYAVGLDAELAGAPYRVPCDSGLAGAGRE